MGWRYGTEMLKNIHLRLCRIIEVIIRVALVAAFDLLVIIESPSMTSTSTGSVASTGSPMLDVDHECCPPASTESIRACRRSIGMRDRHINETE
jgi:hypothetical protein